MKREIKFRGKRLDNGEWVEGTPVWSVNDRCYMIIGAEEAELIDFLCQVEYVEVDPDTVGQFTGLHDANGKEIYEGDVILEDKDPSMLEIVFRDGIFFASIGATHGENPYMNCALRVILDRRKTHVIGNIHDNPELLKTE